MVKRTVNQCLWRRSSIFCKNLLFQGAWVDADPNRDSRITAGMCYSFDAGFLSDVTRIDPDFIHSCGDGLQRNPIIKMNIRNHRDFYRLFDRRNQPHRFQIGDSGPNDFTSGPLQCNCLHNTACNIRGGHVQHRLYGDPASPTDHAVF